VDSRILALRGAIGEVQRKIQRMNEITQRRLMTVIIQAFGETGEVINPNDVAARSPR